MISVEAVRIAGLLLDEYVRLFFEKYKKSYISVSKASDQTIMTDLARNSNYNEMVQLLQQYFKMDGHNNWYKAKAHDLRTFKSAINEISAAVPKKNTYSGPRRKLVLDLHCDSCWEPFKCLVPFSDEVSELLDTSMFHCKKCHEEKRPWRYPTREEFYKNWQAFASTPQGAVFGKIDSYENLFKEFAPYPRPELQCEYL